MIYPDFITHKTERSAIAAHKERSRSIRHATGAGFGLALGVIFPILGGLLTQVGRTHGHLFKFYLGVALLALTLPLLIFGICCLSGFLDDSTPPHDYQGPVRWPFNLPFSGPRSHLLAVGAMGSLLLFSAATTPAQQTIFNVPINGCA